jgi:hypothetical protein
MVGHSTIWRINILCCPYWYAEPWLSVTRGTSQENWNFSIVCLKRIAKKAERSFSREAKEIELHPDDMNGKESFSLSRLRQPLIQTLKRRFSQRTGDLLPLNLTFLHTGPF